MLVYATNLVRVMTQEWFQYVGDHVPLTGSALEQYVVIVKRSMCVHRKSWI